MGSILMGVISRLWELPPRVVVRKLIRRLISKTGVDYDELLRSAKYMRPQRPYDFLSRSEAILARTHQWPPLEFEDRDVVEIGCGPVLGFGPLAVFRGCRSFAAVDPGLDVSVVHHSKIQEKFFLGVHKDLCGIFGPRLGFREFLERLQTRVKPVQSSIVDAGLAGPQFDIVLSHSTLEHIEPLTASVERLHSWCRPDVRFMHLVDFGNHRSTRNPFSGMYSVEPDEYRRHHGRSINLARPPEMMCVLREAGFDADIAPYYSYPEFYDEPITPRWRKQFSDEELFLKVAIIFGPKS